MRIPGLEIIHGIVDAFEGPDIAYANRLIEQASTSESNPIHLSLSACNLSAKDLERLLPTIQDKIPHLNTLWVNNSSRLKTLPVALNKLTSLTELSVSDCTNLKKIPCELYGFIKQLNNFQCGNTKLSDETLLALEVRLVTPPPRVDFRHLGLPARTNSTGTPTPTPCTSPRTQPSRDDGATRSNAARPSLF